MTRIKLYDTLSPDCKSFGNTKACNAFEWYRGSEPCDIAVYTDNNLEDVFKNKKNHKVNIAWLIESPELFPEPYKSIQRFHGDPDPMYLRTRDIPKTMADRFDCVATFHNRTLELKNSVCVPFGGCWIQNPELPKTMERVVSSILSEKQSSVMQKMRHEIMRLFPQVDFYGKGAPVELPHLEKHRGLAPYAYSIVIENCQQKNYFTEKIIDCFATGTIPIYYGCQNIEEYFNGEGIMQFDTIEKLATMLRCISKRHYESRKHVISENYIRAHRYFVPEDMLWNRVISKYI